MEERVESLTNCFYLSLDKFKTFLKKFSGALPAKRALIVSVVNVFSAHSLFRFSA